MIDLTSEVLARYVRGRRHIADTMRRQERSAELVVSALERVRAARATMAPWRRRRIAGGSAGPGQDGLGARVRDLIERGLLPGVEVQSIWAGKGNGGSCRVCDRTITPSEVEFEVEGLRMHRPCYAARIRALAAR